MNPCLNVEFTLRMYLALEGMYITLTQHYNVGHIHF